MKITSWNVNSVRARIKNIIDYIKDTKPDLLMLQEIKTEEKNFPFDDFKNIGYQSYISGQKAYNGVAILTKVKINKMDINVEATFNKDGVSLSKEVEVPFPEINLNIKIDTNASKEQLETIKKELKMYCPISKVITNSGSKINDIWEMI